VTTPLNRLCIRYRAGCAVPLSYILYYLVPWLTRSPSAKTRMPHERSPLLTRDATSVSAAVGAGLVEAARRKAAAAVRAEAEELAADEQALSELCLFCSTFRFMCDDAGTLVPPNVLRLGSVRSSGLSGLSKVGMLRISNLAPDGCCPILSEGDRLIVSKDPGRGAR